MAFVNKQMSKCQSWPKYYEKIALEAVWKVESRRFRLQEVSLHITVHLVQTRPGCVKFEISTLGVAPCRWSNSFCLI